MEKIKTTSKCFFIIVAVIFVYDMGYNSAISTMQTAMFGDALGYTAPLEQAPQRRDTPVVEVIHL